VSISRGMQISILTANRHVPQRIRWAYWLQARICIVGQTIDRMAQPGDNSSVPAVFVLDHISIAALARAAIEACVMIHYVSEQDVSDSEWSLRTAILRLHDTTTRYRMFKSFHEEEARQFRVGIDEIRAEVRTHPLYKSHSPKEEEKLLSGQAIYLGGLRSVVKRIGWDIEEFDATYAYLSSQAHSAPVSFLRTEQYGTDFEAPSGQQLMLSAVAMRHASSAIDDASRRMIELFPDICETGPAWLSEMRSDRVRKPDTQD
jgi:hypothetical protein